MKFGLLILQLLIAFIPWPARRFLLVRIFGANIADSAKIGISLIDCNRLIMNENSKIGHFNFVRGLHTLELGTNSSIGSLNWITGGSSDGVHFSSQTERFRALILGSSSAITNRHFFDCTDAIRIGSFSTVAGWGSQFVTHSIDIEKSLQVCAPILIGDYCFVGSRCILLKSSCVSNFCVLAAGSVVSKLEQKTYALYGGVPARYIKSLPETAAYFHRKNGRVD